MPAWDAGAFYDRAAPDYDRLMATPATVRMRRTFQALVREHVAVPGPILDFGCGTGIDARYYSWLGYRILAYDTSAAMLAKLRSRCPGAIRTGRVLAVSGGMDQCFRTASQFGPFACITSNFAVLNHIDEAEAVLTELGALVKPGGRVILSLLNPWYWRDMLSTWWWRSRYRSRARSGFVVDLGDNRTVRHDPYVIGRQAGFRRDALLGAMRGPVRDRLVGRMADPLVIVMLTRP